MGGRVSENVSPAETEGEQVQYFQVPISLYQPNEIIGEDLYLFYQGQYILFRPKNLLWKSVDAVKLEEFGVKHLYIQCQSAAEYQEFLENNLTQILEKPQIPKEEKAELLYAASNSILGSVFERPSSPANVRRSISFVKNSIDYLKDKDHFYELMSIASADFSEYTHALHVSAYAITLAKEVGIKSFNDISAIGVGALLHDIGKTKIDPKILEKENPLDESERREIERHPEYGYEIVRRQRTIPEKSEVIILQHHERPGGKGYPFRLDGDIAFSTKIVSLCDCFDILTSNRNYKKMMKPMEALNHLKNDLKDDYDQNLLYHFIKILGMKD